MGLEREVGESDHLRINGLFAEREGKPFAYIAKRKEFFRKISMLTKEFSYRGRNRNARGGRPELLAKKPEINES